MATAQWVECDGTEIFGARVTLFPCQHTCAGRNDDRWTPVATSRLHADSRCGLLAPRPSVTTVAPAPAHARLDCEHSNLESFTMSGYRIHVIALLISTAALGCRMNSNYCPGAPNDNCSEIDASPDAAPRCTASTDCNAVTPACDLTKGQCVQCIAADPAAPSACGGTKPVCAADNTCQPCTAHSDCESSSNVCRLNDGACAAEGEVAYVQQGATGTECTKVAPCSLLSTALKKNKTYIKISGAITEPNTITIDNKTVILLAEPRTLATPGAKLTSGFDGILVVLKGGSFLSVYDLEVFGAKGSAGYAVSMPADNLPSTLSLYRATLRNNEGGAIVASGGTLNITQSTLSGNAGGGVQASGGGTLNIRRSQIINNDAGGIIMNSKTAFNIVNNFIIGNGRSDSEVGGIKASPKDSTSKLEFNTIVGNQALVVAGGVICNDPDFTFHNNLLYQNTTNPVTVGGCKPGSSFFQSDLTNPNFRGPADYHLTAATPEPAIRNANTVDCASNPEDYDGEQRPQDGKCDLGADEYQH